VRPAIFTTVTRCLKIEADGAIRVQILFFGLVHYLVIDVNPVEFKSSSFIKNSVIYRREN